MPQRFELAIPPRVLRETTCQGPNASTPTFENGGPGSSMSVGRSAMFWQQWLPRNLRHFTHWLISDETRRLHPVNQ